MRALVVWPGVLVAFSLLGCGSTAGPSGGDVETGAQAGELTSTARPGSATSSPRASVATTAPLGLAEGYVAPVSWRVARQLSVDAALLGRDGVSVEVPFVGGPEGEPTDPCARSYELVLDESEIEVRLALFELEPSTPDEVPENHVCTSDGHGWSLSTTLDQPLGSRRLMDDRTDAPVPVTDLDGVLQPGYVPDGWVSGSPQADDGRLELWYNHPERASAFIYVASSPVSDVSNLGTIRARDLVRVEEITLRTVPAIMITSLEDGAVTLAWEEQERLYQVHGYLVDPSELTAMAESMSG